MNESTDLMASEITRALEKTHTMGLTYGRREGFVAGVITGCITSAAVIFIVHTFL